MGLYEGRLSFRTGPQWTLEELQPPCWVYSALLLLLVTGTIEFKKHHIHVHLHLFMVVGFWTEKKLQIKNLNSAVFLFQCSRLQTSGRRAERCHGCMCAIMSAPLCDGTRGRVNKCTHASVGAGVH